MERAARGFRILLLRALAACSEDSTRTYTHEEELMKQKGAAFDGSSYSRVDTLVRRRNADWEKF